MTQVVLDFETTSAVNLEVAGSYRYWEDATTEILTLRWVTDGGRRGGWKPGEPGDDLRSLAGDPVVRFVAHNAAFEMNGWRQQMAPVYRFPDVVDSRWEDTMAVCAHRALPLALDRATKVLGLPAEKDLAGRRLTLSLSKPNKKGIYLARTPDVMEKVDAYCDGDVAAEASLDARLGKLTRGERSVWLLDQAINRRGVRLDMPFVRAAQQVVERASVPLVAEFQELTGTEPSKVKKVMEWVQGRGVNLPNLQKATILAALNAEDSEDDEAPEAVGIEEIADPVARRALEIRSIIGSASIKKLYAMSRCVGGDGRARGLLQYHGAGTGRWAGRLIQPQNFPRGVVKLDAGTKNERAPDPEFVVQSILTADPDYVAAVLGDPIEVVLSSLRHALIPAQNHAFAVGDFAGIEARIVLAMAGQHDKTALLASGVDAYCDMAASIYGWAVTKANVAERTVGKCAVLGCGFGLGWKSFKRKFAPNLPDEDCQKAVETYRKVWAPCVPKLWYGLEDAAAKAVWDGGRREAYGVVYERVDGFLRARLPSGRPIWYHNPQPAMDETPWGEEKPGWTYQAQKNGRWITVNAYGGLLTENVVQALARDLLVAAMAQCEQNGMPVVLTVHDEIIAEPEKALATKELLAQLMTASPRWTAELKVPIQIDAWVGNRYRK